MNRLSVGQFRKAFINLSLSSVKFKAEIRYTMGGGNSTQRNSNMYPGSRAQMQRNPNFNSATQTQSRTPGTATASARPPAASTTISSPGAYSISRNSSAGAGPSLFRVNIPQNIRPGQEFQVYAGSRVVRVR